jgi:hypothetical protein
MTMASCGCFFAGFLGVRAAVISLTDRRVMYSIFVRVKN